MRSILLLSLLLGACTRDNPEATPGDDMLGGNGDAAMLGGDAAPQDLTVVVPDLTPPPPCNQASDCPSGLACETATGQCTTDCGGLTQTDCNGGCCDGDTNTCIAGNDDVKCGHGGGFCVVCDNDTPACSAGQCINQCNSTTVCGGGFCCNGGQCRTIDDTQCGPAAGGGTCIDCSADATGHACRLSGVCGCFNAGDCPAGKACDPNTRTCGDACNSGRPCNGGCCSAMVNGTCQLGTGNGACGATGGTCLNCASQSTGRVCEPVSGGGRCGCDNTGDCPQGTCNTSTKQCTASCSASNPCNGGCCAIGGGMTTGTCVQGTANNACGATGGNCCSSGHCVASAQTTCGASGACMDCTNAATGSLCLSGSCGCNSSSDCAAAVLSSNTAGKACNTANHACTDVCNGGSLVCNGGCCNMANGRCAGGGADGACGQSAICASCTNTCGAGLNCLVSGSASMCGCKSDSGCNGGACGSQNSCAVTKTSCCAGTGQPCALLGGGCCSGSCNLGGKCDGIPTGSTCYGNPALCTSTMCDLAGTGNCL